MPLVCYFSMTNKKLLLFLFLIFFSIELQVWTIHKENERFTPSLITTVIDLFEADDTELSHFG